MFDRAGFSGATLTQMVEESGFTRGAFYFHFESKEALADEIVRGQADRWSDLLERLARDEPDPLRRLLRLAYVSGALHQIDVVTRAAARLLSERAAINHELPSTYPWWLATVNGLLLEAADRGDVDASNDLEMVSAYLIASWAGIQQRDVSGSLDHSGVADLIHAGWQVSLSSLCREPTLVDELRRFNDSLRDRFRQDPGSLLPPAAETGTDSDPDPDA